MVIIIKTTENTPAFSRFCTIIAIVNPKNPPEMTLRKIKKEDKKCRLSVLLLMIIDQNSSLYLE